MGSGSIKKSNRLKVLSLLSLELTECMFFQLNNKKINALTTVHRYTQPP